MFPQVSAGKKQTVQFCTHVFVWFEMAKWWDQEWRDSVIIHHSFRVDRSCLQMWQAGLSLSAEERRLPKGRRGWDEDWASFVWAWLHPPLWNALSTLSLHSDPAPCQRKGLCSCLALTHLLGNLVSFAAGVSEPDTSRVLKPRPPNFPAMLFPAAVPQLGLMGHRGKSAGFPQRWLLSLK